MKSIYIIIFLFFVKIIISQSYLVPYKVGDKMGLCNEKGKVIVKPNFNGIDYLNTQYNLYANYFKYSNLITKIDTFIYNGKKNTREKEVYSYGLFKNDKLIIENQDCSNFIVYPYFIICSSNPYHPENCNLFNLKGKQLLKEQVYRLSIMDDKYIGFFKQIKTKYTLLAIAQRDEKRNRTSSIAIFDNEKQIISKWLLHKVTELKIDGGNKRADFTGVTYQDNEGYHKKYIRFNNNQIDIVNQYELSPQVQDELTKNESENYGIGGGDGEGTGDSYGGHYLNYRDDNVAVTDYLDLGKEEKKRVQYPETETEKYRLTFYLNKKGTDSLFFVEPNTRELFETQPSLQTFIKVPKDVEIIYLSNVSFTQFLQLIYKKDNKYGILNKGNFSKTLYDTLLYFGGDYIAGTKNKNKYQFGIITASETEILPIAYDSIYGDVKQAEFLELKRKYDEPYNTKYTLSNRKKEYGSREPKFNFAVTKKALITFYKDGKMGILDAVSNNIVFPAEYDFIAENNIHYSEPNVYKFYVFKKNNKYGVTHLDYNSTLKKFETRMLIQPVFSYIPCYYRNHYYKIKDLKLFELFDEDGKSVGYASENGFEYFENIKDKK